VGEEQSPVPERRPSYLARPWPGRLPPAPDDGAKYALLATGGFLLLVVLAMFFFAMNSSSRSDSYSSAAWNDVPVAVANVPEKAPLPRQIVIPAGAAALPVRDKNTDVLPLNAAKGFPQGPGCDAPQQGKETFGTAVAFVHNPLAAATRAKQEHKLAFLLHVSGNFEESRFT
jgi:hypothetical protein